MARKAAALLSLLVLATLLSGCLGGGTIKSYERPEGDTEDEDLFTFTVAKGTDRITILASTKGSPSSAGTAEFVVTQSMGSQPIYLGRLTHGKEDRVVVDDPEPGQYYGIVEYEGGYSGPASMQIKGGGGALFSIGGSFWDIAGVTLALLTMVGGAILYRRHSSRLNREMERIDETFRELRVDVEQCRHELNDMQEDLRRQLMQGRLKESHYLILEKRIERYLSDLDKAIGARPAGIADAGETPLEID